MSAGIAQAGAAGARLERACAVAGLSLRTLQRWHREGGVVQQPEQHVEDDRRAGIADVGVVVDGRPADVHAHARRIERRERLLLAGQRVEQVQRHPPAPVTIAAAAGGVTRRRAPGAVAAQQATLRLAPADQRQQCPQFRAVLDAGQSQAQRPEQLLALATGGSLDALRPGVPGVAIPRLLGQKPGGGGGERRRRGRPG